MSEHRVHKRYDIQMSAEITVDGRQFTGTTRNLSAGGCCVESAHPIPEAASLRVDLFVVIDGVEDERMPPLTTMGTVQWAAETDDGNHAVGVKFEGMSEAQHKWLEQFLAKTGHE
jgi:c-di-GMP-binding flagellar brake protein YcgR